MNKCSMYHHMSAKEWAWGTTAYWKVYSSIKGALSPSHWKNVRGKHRKRTTCKDESRQKGNPANSADTDHHCCNTARGTFSAAFHDKINHYTDLIKLRNYSSLGSKQLRRFITSSCSHFNLDDHHQDILSRCEIDSILRTNERNFSDFLSTSHVSFCATNHLSSNQPMEDQVILATCDNGKNLLAGVIDGHGGFKFGEVVKQRLPYYISAAIESEKHAINSTTPLCDLVDFLIDDGHHDWQSGEEPYWLIQLESFLDDLKVKEPAYQGYMSLVSNPLRQIFGTEVLGDYADTNPALNAKSLLQEAFLRLDEDLLTELSHHAMNNETTDAFHQGLSTSGCCALMVLLRDNDLYVANSGDCRAVLGTHNNGTMTAVQLTQDHTAVSNPDEVARILLEHPQSESRTCIQYGRLLGRLAPLRAFGDIQFKLTAEKQQEILCRHMPNFRAMQSVKTPPYLTVQPDVCHFELQNDDQFLVLASDGLWDMLSNEEVVWLVDGYLCGKGADLLRDKALLSGICAESVVLKDLDELVKGDNVATFLMRYALGGANQHSLSVMLTLPHPEVRMYRDDITVMVVGFDRKQSDSAVIV